MISCQCLAKGYIFRFEYSVKIPTVKSEVCGDIFNSVVLRDFVDTAKSASLTFIALFLEVKHLCCISLYRSVVL